MPNAIKMLLPNATGQTFSNKSVNVYVTHDLTYMVENTVVPFGQLKTTLKNALHNSNSPSVVLRVDKRVDVEHLVDVLKIGNDLEVQMILATKPE